MIDGVVVRPLKPIRDDRGELCEILRSDDELFQRFGQVYYTIAKPGVVKAWHYHKKQTDHLVAVAAPAVIGLYDARDGSPTKGETMQVRGGRDCPTMVRVPPEVYHGFMADGDAETMVINVPTELYNYGEPDEFRASPFDESIPFDWKALGGVWGH